MGDVCGIDHSLIDDCLAQTANEAVDLGLNLNLNGYACREIEGTRRLMLRLDYASMTWCTGDGAESGGGWPEAMEVKYEVEQVSFRKIDAGGLSVLLLLLLFVVVVGIAWRMEWRELKVSLVDFDACAHQWKTRGIEA